jgi:hypothetical protein
MIQHCGKGLPAAMACAMVLAPVPALAAAVDFYMKIPPIEGDSGMARPGHCPGPSERP